MAKIQNIKILFLLSAFYLLFSMQAAQAAQLNLYSQIQEIGISQQFQVDLFLDTENESINAIEGKIAFPQELLELKEIKDGNSIINFWIERPKANNGEILFSGITPGGYNGANGFIFSVVFQVKTEGKGVVEIRDPKVLLNDGEGTSAPLKISNFNFLISNQTSISQTPISKIGDTEAPEPFTPEVASDPEIFDGKYFLVFSTQDKGSGISHYEVCEGSKRKCAIAESPYLLQNQKLNQKIFIKAVDKNSNERIAIVEPRHPLKWYEIWQMWSIIIIITGYILWKWKIKNRKLLSV